MIYIQKKDGSVEKEITTSCHTEELQKAAKVKNLVTMPGSIAT